MSHELFHQARTHLMAHRSASEELSQRCEQVPLSDKHRKVIQRVRNTRWIEEFLSRADDCAFESNLFSRPHDVFYGSSQVVPKDVIAQDHPSIRKGLTTRDHHLLATIVQQAIIFMNTVRSLPGFHASWEHELNNCERAYIRNTTPNLQRLLTQKPNPAEMYEFAMILSRRIAPTCTREVLSFLTPHSLECKL